MNPAHQHLLITHIPVVGACFGLALFLVALLRRNDEWKAASLWLFVAAALAAIPSYLTGAPAGELLRKATGMMPMDIADQHAELAVVALTASLLLGIASLASLGLRYKTQRFSRAATALVLILALATVATMGWTATLGGQIRHSEIQNGHGS